MKYRADLDGLRAIAIILVLVYHGGLSFFPSGFIGVDVFFVISGYLITAIIYSDLNNHRFSFLDFYNRRLWRLQPVLVCLIFFTTLCTLLFFLPDDLLQYSKSARKTSIFTSNLFFNQTTTGYFSTDIQQLPLLHTWSLSIEWQCYLILPLTLYSLHRMVKRQNISRMIFVLTLIFFILTLYYSRLVPAQTYYQFSSRIFEFLIGSCIVFITDKTIYINKYLSNLITSLAFIIILYIASLDYILLGYPNGYAFIVCVATGVLITQGIINPNGLSVKILSFKPLVFIGILSYSLYIWHWTIFTLLRYQGITETPFVLNMTYSAIFIVSYFSWRFIEKPSMKFNYFKFRYTFVCLLALPVALIHFNDFLIRRNQGFPQRFNQELVTVFNQLKQFTSLRRPLCISNKDQEEEVQCYIGAKQAISKTGYLIGDSYSNHFWGFLDILGKSADVTILAQGTSSCITLPGLILYDWWHFKNQIYKECLKQTEHYYQMIEKKHFDYVIIGQLWSNYLSDKVINHLNDERSLELSKKRIEAALIRALNIIITSGAKPVLIKSTALINKSIYQCFFKHIKLRLPYESAQCSFLLTLSDEELWFERLFERMKIQYPQLIVIDPKDVQCESNKCNADINGIPVYRDAGHITDYASYQMGVLYLQKFANPLDTI